MLKREELAILDRAIAELGAQSYLGPWLSSVRAEVEASIVSDLEPAMLPAEAYARAQQTIATAAAECTRRREETDRHTVKTIEEVRARIETFRRRARLELERIAGEI